MIKEIKLTTGQHNRPFDEEGNATMCVQEYVAYLAGEPHSDTPSCVSPVLAHFSIRWNDSLTNEPRQRLRPYAVRQIGTVGDGQDGVRSHMALDWLVRTCVPTFLDLAGSHDHATCLRELASIVDTESAIMASEAATKIRRSAARFVCPGDDMAWAAAGDAMLHSGADAAKVAALDVVRFAAGDAAVMVANNAVAGFIGPVRFPTVNFVPYDPFTSAIEGARASRGAEAIREDAYGALRLAVLESQESAFALLDRMIDPGGLHDVPLSELEMCELNGREPVLYST